MHKRVQELQDEAIKFIGDEFPPRQRVIKHKRVQELQDEAQLIRAVEDYSPPLIARDLNERVYRNIHKLKIMSDFIEKFTTSATAFRVPDEFWGLSDQLEIFESSMDKLKKQLC